MKFAIKVKDREETESREADEGSDVSRGECPRITLCRSFSRFRYFHLNFSFPGIVPSLALEHKPLKTGGRIICLVMVMVTNIVKSAIAKLRSSRPAIVWAVVTIVAWYHKQCMKSWARSSECGELQVMERYSLCNTDWSTNQASKYDKKSKRLHPAASVFPINVFTWGQEPGKVQEFTLSLRFQRFYLDLSNKVCEVQSEYIVVFCRYRDTYPVHDISIHPIPNPNTMQMFWSTPCYA